MKADSLKMAQVFSNGGDIHYVLPHFQREYAWEKSNWQTLLRDLLATYDEYVEDEPPEHFLGALVVIEDGTRQGVIPAFKLVDGQQRLTTVSLLLCALGRLVKDTYPTLYNRIRRLVTNSDTTGSLHYKLLPTRKYGDRDTYTALIDHQELPATESGIPQAFGYFYGELERKIHDGSLDPDLLFRVVTNCLQVVFINLNKGERPYEIFESLNAKSKPLSQADLVRNYIAMRLPESQQEHLFEKYWARVEDRLQEKRPVGRSRFGELTAFLRHYLSMRLRVLCNEAHVYTRFRIRIETDFPDSAAFADEIATLARFAGYYDHLLRPHSERDASVRESLLRLNRMETTTAYPFLLALYDAREQGKISREEFLTALADLENYVVRRFLVGEPTNYLTKMFPLLWSEIDPTDFAESLRRVLTGKNYPSDDRISRSAAIEPLYDRSAPGREKVRLLYESIERHLWAGAGGHASLDGPGTIEHIMPQSLDSRWRAELGPNWEETYGDYLNTLGNLTLVTGEWNSALSNSPFQEKKEKLKDNALRLNSQYFDLVGQWNDAAIRQRAAYLIRQILEIWPALGIPPVTPPPGSKPKALTILGERIPVKAWNEVAFRTAQAVADVADDFEAIAAKFPAYLSRQPFHWHPKQLTNSWWVNMNLSSVNVRNFCRNLLVAANIPEGEWEVEEG